jgi:hypothetical protein
LLLVINRCVRCRIKTTDILSAFFISGANWRPLKQEARLAEPIGPDCHHKRAAVTGDKGKFYGCPRTKHRDALQEKGLSPHAGERIKSSNPCAAMMRPKQASWGIICGFTKKVFSG